MIGKIIFLFIGILLVLSCGIQKEKEEKPKSNLLDRLITVPDISVKEIGRFGQFSQVFDILITQPLDHDNPNGETFQQRIFLSHIDESSPTVFVPDGTGISQIRTLELTNILNAIQNLS